MQAYSKEFRRESFAACDAIGRPRAVAQPFRVSENSVRRIKQERSELGKTAPCTARRRTPLWVAEADRIRAAIAQSPDLTLSELKAYLHTDLSRTTLFRALRQLKLTVKKSPDGQRAAPSRRGPASGGMAGLAGGHRSGPAGVPRRRLGQNQNGPAPRMGTTRPASDL